MKRIFHVARTEILEHRRQPMMLGVLVMNYVLWGGLFVVFVKVLGVLASDPAALQLLQSRAEQFGVCEGDAVVGALLRIASSSFGAVLFTNLPLFVAIMSGYSVLHDRTTNALPFLMLAPLSRFQLLAGKVLGATFLPLLLHLTFVGLTTVALRATGALTDVTQFGGSAAWWVSYLVGVPVSGLLVGSIGTVISALARDVRTSMQFTSFSIGLLSLAIGYAMFDGIHAGVLVQLAAAVAMGVAAAMILAVGARIISRELR